MLVTDDGIVTLLKTLQLMKAESPILVTDDGIVTLVRLVSPLNAK